MLRREPSLGRPARLAPALLFAASLAVGVALVATNPQLYWQQSDAVIYRDAGAAVLHGRPLYPTLFGPAQLPFTYPPFAGLLFAAGSPLPFGSWKAGLAGLSLVGLVGSALAALRLTGRRTADCWPAAFVFGAIGLWLEPVDSTLSFGQINLMVMALVLTDLAFARNTRFGGVGIGLAAGLKITPAIFIGYLLLSGNRREAGTAALTAAATVAIGFLALPADAMRFWGGRILQPGDGPERLVNQSLRGTFLRAAHRATGEQLSWLIAVLAVGVVGLIAAASASRAGLELWGVCLCAASGLLASPISWSHHWVWVLPVLVLAWQSTAPWRWAATASVVLLFAWWPLPVGLHGRWLADVSAHPSGLLRILPHDDGRELRWSGWQMVLGNYYVVAAMLFVLSGSIAVYRRKHRGGMLSPSE
ncbi:MAG: glycosyltransferase 87 family protein [Actinomycetota bacterium]